MGIFKTDPQAADKKALAEQLEGLKKAPTDVRLLMRAAELEHKLALTTDASQHYGRAALRYAEEGFLLKAVAVNKIAYTLVPDSPELLEREADFYKELELIHDAFESIKRAVHLHERRGDRPSSLASRRKLLTIDPENAAGRVAVAEMLVQEGKNAEALDQLSQVAVDLHLQGKHAARDKVKARLAYLRRTLHVAG
jgi:tetratricopeptide (TPR) repeat protein